jgi:hypothetical protein
MSYVPVSSEVHKDKRWLRHPSMEFAKNENIVPIFANELVDAIHTLPVAFVRHEERFVLVAITGLRLDENLLVAENGRWALGAYIPLTYRTRPFTLLEIPGNTEQQALCIEESNLTDGALGEALFDEDGKITEVIGEIFQLLSHYNATRFLTKNICSTLTENGLFTPWEITVNDGVTETPLTGLYRINEEALNSLSDEAFLSLRTAAALPVVYAQLFSMNNITTLNSLLMQRAKAAVAAQKPEPGNGTFSFAGL